MLISAAATLGDDVPESSAAEMRHIDQQLAQQKIADALVERGPFIANPAVLAQLDRAVEGANCDGLGKLVFGCLIQGRVAQTRQEPSGRLANPFNLDVAKLIASTIRTDLGEFTASGGQMDADFLTDPESRLQLVGIVNRMDRKFVPDPRADVGSREDCGEISLIYRFLYAVPGGSSRLPVTMNVVLPALPNGFPVTAQPCREIARRWVEEVARSPTRSTEQHMADLLDPQHGVLAPISGGDIDRIELNIQAYRSPAQADDTDFGSTAAYVIRVFRWDGRQFAPSYLANQIDRTRLLGLAGDRNSCVQAADPSLRKKFSEYLNRPAVVDAIDAGTLHIPLEYLACRAISHSPGGPVRSGNAPFWKDQHGKNTVIDDSELNRLLNTEAGKRAAMFRTPDDLRMRLNELTCSGCHQTRAIAGFHFPGEDRPATSSANAVALAGSPHFFGDQLRRLDFLRLLASGRNPAQSDYRSGYASRPLNKYRTQLAATQLIGGWGAVCLTPQVLSATGLQRTKREWTCNPGLHCEQQYVSTNAPGLGTCVSDGPRQIGDAMQAGVVTTRRFGKDRYVRVAPAAVGPRTETRDTRIPLDARVPAAPLSNSYYVAHQEWYQGDSDVAGQTGRDRAIAIRDAQTGGFPSGMLRLSECRGLPGEATCGLTASNGFNACIKRLSPDQPLSTCFAHYTSFAGLRACSASSPCRDDYICLRSMGYNASNIAQQFAARASRVKGQAGYSTEAGDFGQLRPGASWYGRDGGRGDQRGVCIPPYFVFQFRSDDHPMVQATQ